VVDLAIPQKWVGRGMTLFDGLPNEGEATLAGLSVDEAEELLAGKITRMCGD